MSRGFTLVEVMITLVISGVLMTSVYMVFQSQQGSYQAQEQVAEMQQNLRAGLDIMAHDLRMVGYDIDKNGVKAGTAGIVVADADTITFTVVADTDGIDNDNDSPTEIDEPGELKTIRYYLYDAYDDHDDDLGRKVGSANVQAVAENIEDLEFLYLDSAGAVTATPAAIRRIQISILARVGTPDRKYTNSAVYLPASNPDLGTSWGPYGDHFRRRFQTMTVKCRNMGL